MSKMMYLALVVILAFCACSNSEKKEEKRAALVQDLAGISVSKGQKKHRQELGELESDEMKKDKGSFYYSLNEAKAKKRSTLDAYINIKNERLRALRAKALRVTLSKAFITRCSACHDDYANGIIGPSLLGKSSSFIYQKLIAFKSGKSKNVLMAALTKHMNDKLLKSLASEIASFNKKVGEAGGVK